MGTPYYMSPEQARGDRNLDARVDLYACGVIFYEALTGRRPFTAANYNALLLQILSTKPKPARDFRPALPSGFDAVLDKALARSRDDRYRSAADFQRDLQALRDRHNAPAGSNVLGAAMRAMDPSPVPPAAQPAARRPVAPPAQVPPRPSPEPPRRERQPTPQLGRDPHRGVGGDALVGREHADRGHRDAVAQAPVAQRRLRVRGIPDPGAGEPLRRGPASEPAAGIGPAVAIERARHRRHRKASRGQRHRSYGTAQCHARADPPAVEPGPADRNRTPSSGATLCRCPRGDSQGVPRAPTTRSASTRRPPSKAIRRCSCPPALPRPPGAELRSFRVGLH